jgi:hypothetical protein
MNQVLEEIFRTGESETPNGGTVKVHSHVLMAEGRVLQSLVRELHPSVTLEVGLGYGVAALFICEALREVGGQRHIVIDPAQNDPPPGQPRGWLGGGLHNTKGAGFESLIEFYEEPSFRVLPRLEAQGRVIDFAFVDGWTTFDFKMDGCKAAGGAQQEKSKGDVGASCIDRYWCRGNWPSLSMVSHWVRGDPCGCWARRKL